MKLKINDANALKVIFDCDICSYCQNVKTCPLIHAMLTGLAVPKYGDFGVSKCGHFKRFTAFQIFIMILLCLFFITVFGLEIREIL